MVRSRYSTTILFSVALVALGVSVAPAAFLEPRDAKTVPRARIACYPSSTVGTRYPDPESLGSHTYRFSLSERNGIVYTCRGGHIDISHLRKTADWTAYLASRIREALLKNETRFSYKMREPSKYDLRIEYPSGWRYLPASLRQDIASEIAISLGQYCTYVGVVWHEILTWSGFKSIGFYPEYQSAFSWEDNYSNLLGVRLAGAALRDPQREYSEAMTQLIDRELKELGVQPKAVAYDAGEAVRGHWFVGDFVFCDMVKRNFDTGLDDGIVTPWLAPPVGGCEAQQPQSYPVPNLVIVREYGFRAELELQPREWEKNKLLRVVYPDPKQRGNRIVPARHFAAILAHVRNEAVQRYGPYVDDPRFRPDDGPPQPVTEPATTYSTVEPTDDVEAGSTVIEPVSVRPRQAPAAEDALACPQPIPGDVNGDCQVDASDLAVLAAYWLVERAS